MSILLAKAFECLTKEFIVLHTRIYHLVRIQGNDMNVRSLVKQYDNLNKQREQILQAILKIENSEQSQSLKDRLAELLIKE